MTLKVGDEALLESSPWTDGEVTGDPEWHIMISQVHCITMSGKW